MSLDGQMPDNVYYVDQIPVQGGIASPTGNALKGLGAPSGSPTELFNLSQYPSFHFCLLATYCPTSHTKDL